MTFDSISDLVSLHDNDYKILRANKAFAEVFGMQPQQVVGKTCYELVHGTSEPSPYCPQKKGISTKKPERMEYFDERLGQYLEVVVFPVLDEKGEVVSLVHIVKNVTERKKVEEAQRLSQLGKLVADMAHEVNNPLMIISGNAQLSLMEEVSQELKSNLNIIFEESKRAKDIIQRLLKFSRPSKGEIKEININNCVEAVVGLIDHQFGLANVRIKRSYCSGLPAISGDEKQLQEVFMNLLNNAREAMPEGGEITITTSRERDLAKIDFKDTGCGMTEEVKSKIFVPFFTTKEKGTGLGISVCYGIIKSHGGELSFESAPGKGTIARVLLPLAKEGKANA